MAKSEESSGGGSVLEWVKGLGLPIASLIASAAFFGIQMQQQAFERKLNNVESGYRFYFEKRTALTTASDAQSEIALLQMVGAAFPNVYCNVRADMFKRADALEISDVAVSSTGAPPITDADKELLLAFVRANATPQTGEYSTDFIPVLFSQTPTPHACHSEFDGALVADNEQQEEAAPGPMASATPAPPSAADTAPGATQGPVLAAPPPAPEVRAGRTMPRFERGAVRFDPSQLTLRAQTYRVYFHVRDGGREPASIDPLRAPLAQANFRVMRDVRVIPAGNGFPTAGEVRYYGADQAEAANELVSVLNAQFAGQVTFTARAIGADFPSMPPQNIEVWVP